MEFYERSFSIILKAEIGKDPNTSHVTCEIVPDSDGHYHLLIDYEIIIDNTKKTVERDLWTKQETIFDVIFLSRAFTVSLNVNTSSMLSPCDLTTSVGRRTFQISMNDRKPYFVNPVQLAEFGGAVFKDWKEKQASGENSAIELSMDSRSLRILLEACCLYDNLLIHRRILDELLTLAARLKMAPVLRSLETFILNSETIHPIRKLEYAAEFRMSRLADSVQRAFKSRIDLLDCLHEFMRENNESLDQMHPKVLQILNIGASSIVIG
ncbi:hypothetical protein L596_014853 [Steinernema carpocapsae]|uniref:BTB domain-containing protein n=1 Tax=Steinernema carpocapsae TaxID=34508 RepID=A0A4U5NDZ7_STECR|nr:hypothetical protein L596_014853 [Steinernema carpocapsae]